MAWQPIEDGQTIGQTGSEGGTIQHDEEYSGAARITLEQKCLRAPYAITCGIYGFLVHTRFLADEETALHALDTMKTALAAIVDLAPVIDDDPQWSEKVAAVEAAAAQFVRDFP